MARLQSGIQTAGLTHTFEFDYQDLQNADFNSTDGKPTGIVITKDIDSVSKGGTGNKTLTVNYTNTDSNNDVNSGDIVHLLGVINTTGTRTTGEFSATRVDDNTFTVLLDADPGTLSLSGAKFTFNQVFGANNQMFIARIPRGASVQIAGIAYAEATSGISDLELYVNGADVINRALSDTSNTTFTYCGDDNADARSAGYSLIVNNGTAYKQTLASFLTGSVTGLNGLNGGTDAENGAAAALALYSNRDDSHQERSYEMFGPASGSSDLLYLQAKGTLANMTAGKFMVYFQIVDPLAVINGGRPAGLE